MLCLVCFYYNSLAPVVVELFGDDGGPLALRVGELDFGFVQFAHAGHQHE